MATDVPVILAYQLPELVSPRSAGSIPLSPAKLGKWLDELPVLNIKQLSFDLPNYLHKFNQVNMPDKQRLAMLELLRLAVGYLHTVLTKRFSGKNFNLSEESQEIQWLAMKLISGMAMGYQRLLYNINKKGINIINRSHYTLLAQRTMYYLGEKICLSYVLSATHPKGLWQDFNTTYAFCRSLNLNSSKLKDSLAYGDIKGNIDALYYRVLVLTMASPYTLRGAEISQVYSGVTPWADSVSFDTQALFNKNGYAMGFNDDYGPIYYPDLTNISGKIKLDNSVLLLELKQWQDTATLPDSVNDKGMSDKLLDQLITNLEAKKRRSEPRFKAASEPMEIVMGLQDIDIFLGHIDALIENDEINSPIPEVDMGNTISEESETDWDKLRFYTPEVKITSARDIPMQTRQNAEQETEEITVRRHRFTVENESKMGACISCNNLHGTGLFIGEMMFIRGYDPEIWTLGIVRWMKTSGKTLQVGLYLVSAHVDSVEVIIDDVSVNALWIAESDYGDTLLLPKAQFNTDDQVQIIHNGEDFFAILDKEVWHSEGFSQFTFLSTQ